LAKKCQKTPIIFHKLGMGVALTPYYCHALLLLNIIDICKALYFPTNKSLKQDLINEFITSNDKLFKGLKLIDFDQSL